MHHFLKTFQRSLLSLDRLAAERCITEAVEQFSTIEIVDHIIAEALRRIGDDWKNGSVALSQVYMSGRICEGLVDQLLPPGATQRKKQPSLAIAVLEDHHFLGKRIVYAIVRAAGFDITDFGHGSVAEIISQVRAGNIEILLLSTLMLHSALAVRDVVHGLALENLNVKIVVGGAPFLFDPHLWQEVKADAMARSAGEAPAIITSLTGAGG